MAGELKNAEFPGRKLLEWNWHLAEVMGFDGGDRQILPPTLSKIYKIWSWIGMVIVITFSTAYSLDPTIDSEGLAKSFVVSIGVTMLTFTKVTILMNKDRLGILFIRTRSIYSELAEHEQNWPDLRDAEQRSMRLIKIMALFFLPHIPLCALQAGMKMLLSGEPAYPFEMATFGMPVALSWIIQLTSIALPILFVWGNHALLRIIIIQMSSYTTILVRLLEERPILEDKAYDRRMFKLLNDLYMMSADVSSLYGAGAALELAMAPARSCFACYHLQLALKSRNFESAFVVILTFITCIATSCSYGISGEDIAIQHQRILDGISNSNWYKCPSSARKPIIKLFTMSRTPMRMHYKYIMEFRIEQISNLMQTTYTLATALANFL
ncbi:Hypothetical protein NTJ_04895 [Nesidiocoris tenuis]|uniref:Odorant receptor n=1 Tax=Nesidiocoris tenuis TaxID=355587 RepID=A0ABN7ALA0_9HEMI|nr:Hypothetical protein NTJ_04895 [Nesidiocoris tenuis]